MATMPILKERGHLLVMIGEKRAIIDTGAPISISAEPFDFLGMRHSPPSNVMGATPRNLSDMAGFQIDILIGCDILSPHTVCFRWGDGVMEVGEHIQHSPVVSKMDALMGIPVFPLMIQGLRTKALFDTGAHLSYITPKLVDGLISLGQRHDFHPLAGQFVVPTYRVATALDEITLDIEYGVLSGSLSEMLERTMAMSDSLAVIGTQILDYFDCTISWTQQQISWKRR